MPKTRQQKEEALKNLLSSIADSKAMVFLNYHGLSVPEMEDLRKKLRAGDVEMKVIKKTLLQKAFNENKIKIDVKSLGQGLAVLFGKGDEVAPARVTAAFAKDHQVIKIYGGVLEDEFIDQARVAALSKLQSRKQLYAKLIGSINAPLSGFVNALAGNIRGLVNVLNGIKDLKS